MEANLNVNPNDDDDDLKSLRDDQTKIIPIVIAIVVTIIVYYAKK